MEVVREEREERPPRDERRDWNVEGETEEMRDPRALMSDEGEVMYVVEEVRRQFESYVIRMRIGAVMSVEPVELRVKVCVRSTGVSSVNVRLRILSRRDGDAHRWRSTLWY